MERVTALRDEDQGSIPMHLEEGPSIISQCGAAWYTGANTLPPTLPRPSFYPDMPKTTLPTIDLSTVSTEEAAALAEHPDFLARPLHAGLSDMALAAKNIRILLKKNYPNVRFSVKSRSSTMHAAIDVAWAAMPDAPSQDSVKRDVLVFKEGAFNTNNDDSYAYTEDVSRRAFLKMFGGVEYVSTDTHAPSPEDVRRWEGEVLRREMTTVLSTTNKPAPKRVRARL